MDSITALHGETITAPDAPTKDGFTLSGWYEDAELTNLWDFDTDTVTSNISLYAAWIYVEYSIGDEGPAGGWIFYDNPDYVTDGWRYIEAAPELTATGIGKANTEAIVAAFGEQEPDELKTDYAAKLCYDLVEGGYGPGEWYLPSKDELYLMYENLHNQTTPIGGFADDQYWSSSEYSNYGAWYQNLGAGYQDYDDKDFNRRVRAARRF